MTGDAREDQFLTLPGGRRLGFAEYGDPAGAPLVFFHGFPGSRLMFRLGDEPARKLGIRLIAPDRPGLGLSDFQSGRKVADVAADTAALADHLGLARFAVAGVSGGAPYAVACGAELPERVSAVGLVSAMASAGADGLRRAMAFRHRAVFALARGAPWAARPALGLFRFLFARYPERCIQWAMAVHGGADARLLAETEARDALIAAGRDAFRSGTRGPLHDLRLLAGPWGVDPARVAAPTRLWHGEADEVVPVEMGRWLAARIPNCRAEFLPGAGHFWIVGNAAIVLGALMESVEKG